MVLCHKRESFQQFQQQWSSKTWKPASVKCESPAHSRVTKPGQWVASATRLWGWEDKIMKGDNMNNDDIQVQDDGKWHLRWPCRGFGWPGWPGSNDDVRALYFARSSPFVGWPRIMFSNDAMFCTMSLKHCLPMFLTIFCKKQNIAITMPQTM